MGSGGEQGKLGESTVCQFGTTEENFGTEKGTGGTKGTLSTRCSQGGGEKHLLYGGGGARPICAQPRVGSHPIPAVDEEAEAEGKASSSCSSKESVPELQAG